MKEFSVGVATFFAACVLFSILLPPGLTALALIVLTITVGTGGIVLISQRESRKEDRLYRTPYRRPLPPTIDVKSWED